MNEMPGKNQLVDSNQLFQLHSNITSRGRGQGSGHRSINRWPDQLRTAKGENEVEMRANSPYLLDVNAVADRQGELDEQYLHSKRIVRISSNPPAIPVSST